MNPTKIHTVLIGTSKTEPGFEYYCKGSNVSKFWGTLSSKNKSFDADKPETEKLLNRGIWITDISGAAPGEERGDKSIKAGKLQKGFIKLETQLEQYDEIEQIGFIGKQAARWFFVYFLRNIELNDSSSITVKAKLFDYGAQTWTLSINNRSIDCYLLPNTGRQWNKKEWELFWEAVFSES